MSTMKDGKIVLSPKEEEEALFLQEMMKLVIQRTRWLTRETFQNDPSAERKANIMIVATALFPQFVRRFPLKKEKTATKTK